LAVVALERLYLAFDNADNVIPELTPAPRNGLTSSDCGNKKILGRKAKFAQNPAADAIGGSGRHDKRPFQYAVSR
jgi:hypothetical protein